jgi:hypothetical protein
MAPDDHGDRGGRWGSGARYRRAPLLYTTGGLGGGERRIIWSGDPALSGISRPGERAGSSGAPVSSMCKLCEAGAAAKSDQPLALRLASAPGQGADGLLVSA